MTILLVTHNLVTHNLVTHNIDESIDVGDRVLVLRSGPGKLRADPAVDLPRARDQIATKETREFARLRAEVSGFVRGRDLQGEVHR